ncbi:S-methyl-5-thioribose kinase [Clostridium aciditolerans]|uniref:S-methyl-5-thioribose kinase n=1 Tax=Clostridium aciditolerans TaxID=339861 RepID=A0A934HUD1_9CLOT|nr:S-methyl-5-thioribose kinase [Clostridium aciditolerans]MBI6874460.1 S-methyl-5-thioribose kinase [Clostridium aciditolerans]
MSKYSEHFLMNAEEAKIYSKEVAKYFTAEEEVAAVEIGDGNINYVFKIWNPKTGKSLIIKQADKLLRSSGRPLDINRNRIEAEILKIEGTLAQAFVPKIYHYDETMCALCMEDISEYKNLRTELLSGKTFHHLADNISTFLADTLLPTTDLVIDRADKKDRVSRFTNKELCDISEDLVFTEPYYNYKNRNIIIKENENFVENNLYNNERLKAEVGILRDRFMNHAQALIHGDLHSGSIFANEKGIKVIDPEFAFYGPMGYDVGNVIGNLFFSWANKYYTEGSNSEFLSWIEEAIRDTYDLFAKKLSEKYDAIVKFNLYNSYFKEHYIKEVLADSLGYAGTEIIRRVVGDSKVLEVTSVKNLEQRIPMERALIKIGISLIMNRYRFTKGSHITEDFKLILS